MRGPRRIRDDSWRHVSASYPGPLVERLHRLVPARQRSAALRRALTEYLDRLEAHEEEPTHA